MNPLPDIIDGADGNFSIQYELMDVAKQQSLLVGMAGNGDPHGRTALILQDVQCAARVRRRGRVRGRRAPAPFNIVWGIAVKYWKITAVSY